MGTWICSLRIEKKLTDGPTQLKIDERIEYYVPKTIKTLDTTNLH